MNITLQHPYKSIENLETEDLPDFALLIGRNGSGKTQLLEALNEGQAVISGISSDDTELHNMSSFLPPNSGGGIRRANHFARITADAYLNSVPKGQSPIEEAAEIFDEFTSDIERESGAEACAEFVKSLISEIQQLQDFTIFGADGAGSNFMQTLYRRVLEPFDPHQEERQRMRRQNQSFRSFEGNQAALISAAMKLAAKLPHRLTIDDILNAIHYEGQMLSNSISEVFVAYKVDEYAWAHERIETENTNFAELIKEYRNHYLPPWVALRNILESMRDAAGDDGLFDFDFDDPDEYQLNMANFAQFTFKAEMTNRTTGARYDLDSLSSGEKVLMALCIASFNQYLGRRMPKLLLLDELDAVLHPSMVAALVRTLKTLYVANGTKILMTTHSAMTAAALEDSDIYRVSRSGWRVKVSSTTRSQAINELSEGFATADVGLKIAAYDAAKVTILTEGNNSKHLKKWVDLNFPTEVHVFEELGEHTSAQQLLEYGRLLGRVNTNTHFVVVWDCDAKSQAETLRDELPSAAKVTPYAFALRQDNTIIRRGIENIYDEKLLEPYSTTTKRDDGTLLGRGFDNSRKTEFANHVLQHGTAEYFTHIQDLHGIIKGILETIPATSQSEYEEGSPASNGRNPDLLASAQHTGKYKVVLE